MQARHRPEAGWTSPCGRDGRLARLSLVLLVVMAAGLHGGAHAGEQVVQPDALHLEDAGFSLLHRGEVVRTVEATGAIETLGTDGRLVVWTIADHGGRLFVRPASADEVPVIQVPLDREADALCVAAINETHADLFLADGDGSLFHYWLAMGAEPELRLVRVLPTNPEVTGCEVDDERVYFVNPPMGIASYARDPETDAVMELVYAAGPAGRGSMVPAAFRLDRSRAGTEFVLWNEDGEAFALNPARPDALAPVAGLASVVPLAPPPRAAGPKVAAVSPNRETAPVPNSGDAADDPAILVGPSGAVWIAGTNKRSGLHIYDLSGRELHRIDRGRLNNVDALELDGGGHLLAASNRTRMTLDLFRANVEEGRIEFAAELPLALNDPYGLCMGRRSDGSMVVFVGGTDGTYQMWAVDPEALRGRLVREFAFESQTEGCVYDSVTGTLYVGEEARGVWAVEPELGRKRLFARADDGVLVPDVEGLDIYRVGETAWLIVSSQGDDSYVIYPLPEGRAPIKFRIAADVAAGIDGASETDGLAVSGRPLPGYPTGLLVVQDGRNRGPVESQNFKLVDWRKVAALLDPGDPSD